MNGRRDISADAPWAKAGLLGFGLLLWACVTNYEGITHDAVLYAFQALARINPQTLAHDVFLTESPQDRLTIFPAVLAALVNLLGTDNAVLAITLASQAAFLAVAWMVARSFSGPKGAALAVLLLISLPSFYGAERTFRYLEPLATPRLPAEVFVLLSLWAVMAGRRLIACLGAVLALALHPLMAFPAVILVAGMELRRARPEFRIAPVAFLAACLGVALLAVLLLQRTDSLWFSLIQERVPYVLLGEWSLEDWAQLAPRLAALYLGAILLSGEKSWLLSLTLLMTLVALLASVSLGDFAQLTAVLQLQPWRAVWLASALAVVVLPAIAVAAWNRGDSARCAILLLGAAGFIDAPAPVILLSALACAAGGAGERLGSYGRRLYRLSMCIAAATAAWAAFTAATASATFFWEPRVSTPVNAARALAQGALLAGLIVTPVWWLCVTAQRAWQRHLLLAGIVILSGVLGPNIWREWRESRLDEATTAALAPWRAAIPAQAQVLWVGDVRATWLQLQRASFISPEQTTAVLFSRAAALELDRRAAQLAPYYPRQEFMSWRPRPATDARGSLAEVCHRSSTDFIVAPASEWNAPALGLDDSAPRHLRAQRLIRCADLRAAAATSGPQAVHP